MCLLCNREFLGISCYIKKVLCPVQFGTKDDSIVVPPLFEYLSQNTPHCVQTHTQRCIGRPRLTLLDLRSGSSSGMYIAFLILFLEV